MRPGRAADHSTPSSDAVMEESSYNYTKPVGHTGPVTGSLYLFLPYSDFLPAYTLSGLALRKLQFPAVTP